MARKAGSKNKKQKLETENNLAVKMPEPEENHEAEPEDKYISNFEAADMMNTDETTIKMWIDHGHLRGGNGRVSVRSITECRFNNPRRII